MLSASPSLAAFLAANNVAWRGDCYSLTLQNGTVYRWTSADLNLSIGGNTFLCAAPGIAPVVTRGGFRNTLMRGGVDQLDITLGCANFTIGGKTLSSLALQGFFRGSRMVVDHYIGVHPLHAISLGGIAAMFSGPVGDIEPQGPDVVLHCNSQLIDLQQKLPRFVLAPTCGNAVYDPNCGLSKAAFTDSGAASGTLSTTQVQSTTAAVIARPASYYNLGVVTFTSGANAGLKRAVKAFSVSGGTATITLALPFPTAPASSDTFAIYPGCPRTKAACSNNNSALAPTFNNLAQYRGFPHIPSAEAGS